MRKISFAEAVAQILEDDPRFAPESYQFVREALDFTTAMLSKPVQGPERHVTGTELVEGIRKYAIQEYAAMAMTVLDSWGMRRCEDFGHIVFNLVNKGVLGKTDEDSIHDFEEAYDFETAFRKPFEPKRERERMVDG